MSTLADSDDPDTVSHYMAFPLGIHCLLLQKLCSEKEMHFFRIKTVTSDIYNVTPQEYCMGRLHKCIEG